MAKKIELLNKAAAILEKIAEKCGGPGSGVPGPCPGPDAGKPSSRPGRSRKPPVGAKPPVVVVKEKHVDSLEKHLTPEGRKKLTTGKDLELKDFTPERQALHKAIIDAHFEGKTPVKNPTAYIMGGGPASGKSSILKSGQVSVEKNTVHIDSDAIKAKLPEYQEKTKAGDLGAAAFAHEESSFLAKQVQDRGSSGSYNTLLDGTGDGSVKGLKSKIDKMRAAGQKVVGHYVTCSTKEALRRNLERAKKTGRLPPPAMVKACHRKVSEILAGAMKAGLFDSVDLYDTGGSGKPRKVAEGNTEGMKVLNSSLWGDFVKKGKEKHV